VFGGPIVSTSPWPNGLSAFRHGDQRKHFWHPDCLTKEAGGTSRPVKEFEASSLDD